MSKKTILIVVSPAGGLRIADLKTCWVSIRRFAPTRPALPLERSIKPYTDF